jgi:hypothetical protein
MTPRAQSQQAAPGRPTPAQPTADQSATPTTRPPGGALRPAGSAIIRGSVQAADTGAPLHRAQVRAFSGEYRTDAYVLTDAEGRFEFRDLPGGRYWVSATRVGYVPMQYGQGTPGGDGATAISLDNSQIVENLSVRLLRAAAISGTILDESGEPVSNLQVQALQVVFRGGNRRLQAAAGVGAADLTDDRGTYRLYGLAPGEYFVSATPLGSRGFGSAPTSTPRDGYTPTYYPGTVAAGDAQRIVLDSGRDTEVSFALVSTRLSRVSGRVLSSQGQPVTDGSVRLIRRNARVLASLPPRGSPPTGYAMLRSGGVFHITDVAPGRYLVVLNPGGVAGRDPRMEIGRADITVSGEDVDNLTIVTVRPAIARGHIVTDAGVPPPFKARQVLIIERSADPAAAIPGNLATKINDDFSFEIGGVMDRTRIHVGILSSEGLWNMRGLFSADGSDLTETGLTVAPGEVAEGLRIVIAGRVAPQ